MQFPRSKSGQHFHLSSTQTFGRRAPLWQGLRTEVVVALQPPPFEYLFKFPHSMVLVASSESAEEIVALDGLPESALRDVEMLLPGQGSLDENLAQGRTPSRGGLSGWQRNKVVDFIEDHLNEVVRLATLAALVSLSPYHFARAFKQSFGLPPHRYHLSRRIERAKALLAEPQRSVTEIALVLGFAETSAFSATFRKVTGASPRDWRRSLR